MARRLGATVLVLMVVLTGCGTSDEAAPPQSEENAATSAQAGAGGTVRYLALGDSLSQGVGAPDEQTGAFPALLADRWRDAGCDVEFKNVGVSGHTAEQVIAEQLPTVSEFQPTLVTFQAGGNDIVMGVPLEQYRANVGTVLDQASAGGARVVVLAQNEWFRSPEGQYYATDAEAQREAFDAALIDEATTRGLDFVDLRSLYKTQADEGQWVEDGLHPSAEAYAAWSEALATEIPAPCS